VARDGSAGGRRSRWPEARPPEDGSSSKRCLGRLIWPATPPWSGTCVRSAADSGGMAANGGGGTRLCTRELPNLSLRAMMENVFNIQLVFCK
jgi:hypothetical protein